ncbi:MULTISPECIES: hypothetical protein [unclassified Streptococcus]
MKKLLKYGVTSLTLVALGAVATATELPVIGTTVVRAEENVAQMKVIASYGYSEDGE